MTLLLLPLIARVSGFDRRSSCSARRQTTERHRSGDDSAWLCVPLDLVYKPVTLTAAFAGYVQFGIITIWGQTQLKSDELPLYSKNVCFHFLSMLNDNLLTATMTTIRKDGDDDDGWYLDAMYNLARRIVAIEYFSIRCFAGGGIQMDGSTVQLILRCASLWFILFAPGNNFLFLWLSVSWMISQFPDQDLQCSASELLASCVVNGCNYRIAWLSYFRFLQRTTSR